MKTEAAGKAVIEAKAEIALTYLVVRKEHLLCTKCYEIEPIHPGDGTPAISFITALELAAIRHADCSPTTRKRAGKP